MCKGVWEHMLWSLNEVIGEVDLECLNVEKTRRIGCLEGCSSGRALVDRLSQVAAQDSSF